MKTRIPRPGLSVLAALLCLGFTLPTGPTPALAAELAENPAAVESGASTTNADSEKDELATSERARPARTVFEEILISAPLTPLVGPEHEIGREEITEIPYGDAAEVLRSVSGVAVGRMGGHGLEPRLRGMGEGNINVLLDGAYVHNACPNRMDPPTSFGAVASFDRVVVLKGVQTVRYGGGGSAGTILYERETPRLDENESWRLSAGSAWASHSNAPDLVVDLTAGTPDFYLRVVGEIRDVGDYTDGGGEEIRTAFRKRDLSLAGGWTPSASTAVELSFERNLTEDALFAGSGMDAPFDENSLYRFQLEHSRDSGRLIAIETDLYWGEIDHVMDNYSLRPRTAPMAAKAETASDTFGGRLSVDARAGANTRLTLGADFQRNARLAARLVGPNPDAVTRLQSVLWPDAEITDTGLFVEGVHDLDGTSRILFGTRIDRFEANLADADRTPFGPNLSPRALYTLYYGSAPSAWRLDDVTAFTRFETRLAAGPRLFAGVSRSVRPADATERYLASNAMAPAGRWIGNPSLDAARHHQLDLGISVSSSATQFTGVVFADFVQDYILRDRARGQSGVARSDLASIYRNVEAELYGVELDWWRRLRGPFSVSANAGWVHASNTSDDRPIAQIPPLQGRVRLDLESAPWTGAVTARYAFEQNRIDDNPVTGSGLDAGATPGYVILDLLGRHRFDSGIEIQLGIENLLDRLYFDHLNRSSLFDVEQVRLTEPGRTFWLRLGFQGKRDRRGG